MCTKTSSKKTSTKGRCAAFAAIVLIPVILIATEVFVAPALFNELTKTQIALNRYIFSSRAHVLIWIFFYYLAMRSIGGSSVKDSKLALITSPSLGLSIYFALKMLHMVNYVGVSEAVRLVLGFVSYSSTAYSVFYAPTGFVFISCLVFVFILFRIQCLKSIAIKIGVLLCAAVILIFRVFIIIKCDRAPIIAIDVVALGVFVCALYLVNCRLRCKAK